ncbi:hypothetical protein PAPYR_4979 [Paratrimastix pyriformis]|uniref:DRBM domain-containing protein n=1 Tax=Paratrimastix pyriformis TaxID=342808 RepID=A0ABQ8UIX2_9EUKA|nr:hypothetical protein PAPYR_4979 [Paratrimastix pyriformis]
MSSLGNPFGGVDPKMFQSQIPYQMVPQAPLYGGGAPPQQYAPGQYPSLPQGQYGMATQQAYPAPPSYGFAPGFAYPGQPLQQAPPPQQQQQQPQQQRAESILTLTKLLLSYAQQSGASQQVSTTQALQQQAPPTPHYKIPAMEGKTPSSILAEFGSMNRMSISYTNTQTRAPNGHPCFKSVAVLNGVPYGAGEGASQRAAQHAAAADTLRVLFPDRAQDIPAAPAPAPAPTLAPVATATATESSPSRQRQPSALQTDPEADPQWSMTLNEYCTCTGATSTFVVATYQGESPDPSRPANQYFECVTKVWPDGAASAAPPLVFKAVSLGKKSARHLASRSALQELFPGIQSPHEALARVREAKREKGSSQLGKHPRERDPIKFLQTTSQLATVSGDGSSATDDSNKRSRGCDEITVSTPPGDILNRYLARVLAVAPAQYTVLAMTPDQVQKASPAESGPAEWEVATRPADGQEGRDGAMWVVCVGCLLDAGGNLVTVSATSLNSMRARRMAAVALLRLLLPACGSYPEVWGLLNGSLQAAPQHGRHSSQKASSPLLCPLLCPLRNRSPLMRRHHKPHPPVQRRRRPFPPSLARELVGSRKRSFPDHVQ